MASKAVTALAGLLASREDKILAAWLSTLAGATADGRISRTEIETQARDFLRALRESMSGGDTSSTGSARLRDMLSSISRSRALLGFSPSETATFVFSLKLPLFEEIRAAHGSDGEALARDTWTLTELLDQLGLHTIEVFQKSREEIIQRQQDEISELSTPVVKLWNGILALPLIGTLDSARTQVVMENLLQSIVDNGAEIAIIDITGVPTVDTLVAQHLLKTVAAARLMGADCIVSGIRPQIAQTMVHLGVELNVVSKASLADAFALALTRIGRTVVPIRSGGSGQPRSTGAYPGALT
ncbi:STAS domain-containing protein [Belnapia sp. T6]|uniref:STAS domain-containing protein n=1 Tax=Belnapia mucosa TaxID=2804532 RepID=A0ABS1V329_9PROT|nr:STAS domain-containing protein [Belnapia mucosa]MBL6456105.1 STAS domain-containing protein [Belnapia mucosa]